LPGVPTNRLHRVGIDRAAVAGGVVCVVAIAADLLTKTYAVDTGRLGLVAYNDTHAGDFARRVAMSLVAVVFAAAITVAAGRRGLGRQWGAWLGTGLLVGGVLANGLSSFIWSHGVPDFIHLYSLSPDVWDVADFEIAIGLTGGIASVALGAVVAYARGRRRPAAI
jgi:ABC-type Fe3+ transport system permease subunit